MTKKRRMAATKQSKERIDHSYQVWDTYTYKLLLYVIDAKDCAAKDSNGFSDPYAVIEHGKFKKQTKIIEKTLNPVWNECFFIQANPTLPVKVEVWDYDKIGSPDYMGHTVIDLNSIPEDRIVDLYPALLPRKEKKKEKITGTIHLRVYRSSARESRANPTTITVAAPQPDLASGQFLYRPYKTAFKPGDLIGYGGHGVISGLQKVLSGNPITSVGMVLYLPNKWTGDIEPYVVELTRNVNRNIDVFSETSNKSGIYIFHLFERFHQFHGSDLVHFPLAHPLPPEMYKKIVEKVWEYHKKNSFIDETRETYRHGAYLPILNTVIRKKKNWFFEKNEKLVEATSFDFVFRLYGLCGVLTTEACGANNIDYKDPADILRSNLFSPPVLIRQLPGESPLFFFNNQINPPGVAPSPHHVASPSLPALPTLRVSAPHHVSVPVIPTYVAQPPPVQVLPHHPSFNSHPPPYAPSSTSSSPSFPSQPHSPPYNPAAAPPHFSSPSAPPPSFSAPSAPPTTSSLSPQHPSSSSFPRPPSTMLPTSPVGPPSVPPRSPRGAGGQSPRGAQNQGPTVALTQLEMDMLTGLLDGVVVDDHLTVTKHEFRQRMVSKGISVFKDEAKFDAFYKLLDTDGDGRVDLRELVCALAIFVDGSADQKLLAAFKVFDRDGDRYITKQELRKLFSAMIKASNRHNPMPAANHQKVVEEFVVQIFSEYDKNNDGKLSLEEFLMAAHSNSAVGNLFLTVSSLV